MAEQKDKILNSTGVRKEISCIEDIFKLVEVLKVLQTNASLIRWVSFPNDEPENNLWGSVYNISNIGSFEYPKFSNIGDYLHLDLDGRELKIQPAWFELGYEEIKNKSDKPIIINRITIPFNEAVSGTFSFIEV